MNAKKLFDCLDQRGVAEVFVEVLGAQCRVVDIEVKDKRAVLRVEPPPGR